MISKQSETLKRLKASLGRSGEMHHVLLEKFFYALAPMEMRSVFEVESLKTLFLLLLQGIKTGDRRILQQDHQVVAVCPVTDLRDKRRLLDRVAELRLPPHSLAHFALEMEGTCHLGYLYLAEEGREAFLAALSEGQAEVVVAAGSAAGSLPG